MMSSSSPPTHLSVLVNHGSTLAAFQRKAMSQKSGTDTTKIDTETQESITTNSVLDDIRLILKEIKNAKDEGSSLEEKGVTRVLGKIAGILQLINDVKENDKDCQKLDEVKDALNQFINSEKRSSDDSADSAKLDDSTLNQVYQTETREVDFNSFTREEKQCLSFYHTFFSFSASDKPVRINKRELIHWWMGMDLIEDASQAKELLSKLVAEDLLLNPGKDSWYTMPSMTLEQLGVVGYIGAQKDRLFVAYNHRVESSGAEGIVAAINTNAYTLNAKILEWLFQMKNAKVVHLGSWHQGMDYVVIEDMIIKTLYSLKSLKEVRFLSFQGVSRLQGLPTSVYNLENLKVLDLRDCQDLRILPKGIESLKQLRHLDLSHCYELKQIPKGITALSNLLVLKGFVINDDDLNQRILLAKYKTSSCPFNQLSKLSELTKLTIRTKMMSFPRPEDAETLCEMHKLTKLKITWVRTDTHTLDVEPTPQSNDYLRRFPTAIQKLELQASPQTTALRLLNLISNRSQNKLEKLYIRGRGPASKLDPQKFYFPNVKLVRFRYLYKLHMDWYRFRLVFPNVSRFEMFRCPHLIFFPTDENGVWEEL